MKEITKVNIRKQQSCCGTTAGVVAQCCSKSSRLVAGCHD